MKSYSYQRLLLRYATVNIIKLVFNLSLKDIAHSVRSYFARIARM